MKQKKEVRSIGTMICSAFLIVSGGIGMLVGLFLLRFADLMLILEGVLLSTMSFACILLGSIIFAEEDRKPQRSRRK